MFLVTIDLERLSIRVNEELDRRGLRGVKQDIIRQTGISHATFYRFLEGRCDNINVVLSMCAYFGWDVNSFIQNRTERKKDWILV